MRQVKSRLVHDLNAIIDETSESSSVKQQMSRLHDILDTNCGKPGLKVELAKLMHSDESQCNSLLALLEHYESIFDGSELATWKGGPVDIELKPDAKPCHAREFPIPHIHK